MDLFRLQENVVDVALPLAQRRFVDSQLKTGRYLNSGEVVRDALRWMETRYSYSGLSLADGDIMAEVFIVMMEAAKSAREDLKEIMGEVKAINAAKASIRVLLNQVRRDASANCGRKNGSAMDFSRGLGSERAYHRVPLPHFDPDAPGGVRNVATDIYPGKIMRVEELCTIVDEVKGRLDSLSEMGEEQQLRMQMVMERMSKCDTMLSNALKKMSDTAAAIVQNLK